MDKKTLAEKIYNLVAWWDRDGATVADIVKQLEENPLDVIAWLLDYIEENEN